MPHMEDYVKALGPTSLTTLNEGALLPVEFKDKREASQFIDYIDTRISNVALHIWAKSTDASTSSSCVAKLDAVKKAWKAFMDEVEKAS
jgi:hypothetical protein